MSNLVKSDIKSLVYDKTVENRLTNLYGIQKTRAFQGALLEIAKDAKLAKCKPDQLLGTALQSVLLDLPLDRNLGFCYVIAYKSKTSETPLPQFQIGYKGFIQLAIRSRQYHKINVIEIYQGQLIEFNPLTEDYIFDITVMPKGEAVGYCAYFELLNGFKKTVYWAKEKVINHQRKFSKSGDIWNSNFDEMAKKTVLKNALTKYGVMSVELSEAVKSDQASYESIDNRTPQYIDNAQNSTVQNVSFVQNQNEPTETVEDSDFI